MSITESTEPLPIKRHVLMLVYLIVRLHEMKLAVETLLNYPFWEESVKTAL